MQVAAGRTVRLSFDADPVAVAIGRARERVAAEQRRGVGVGPDPNGHELAWLGRARGQLLHRHEPYRDHACALPIDAGHPEGKEPAPGRGCSRRRVERHVPGVRSLIEQGLERLLPPLAECRDAQGTSQAVAWMPRQVEQPVHLGHGHGFRARRQLGDLVTGLDLPLLQHPQVEARTSVGHEQRGHLGLVHPDPHPVTGHPRLGHLELGVAYPVPVTDADLVVGQALHREVLAELPVGEVVPAELLLPVAVGLDLVHEHGTLLAAVAGAVPLPVAVDVEAPHHLPALHRLLPDPGVDRPAPPLDIPGQADVHREEPRGSCPRPPPSHTGRLVAPAMVPGGYPCPSTGGDGRIAAVRLGIAHHYGWAVAVTASADHRVVDRRRIELIEPGLPSAPIHHEGGPHLLHRSGEPLDDAGLAALVADVRASVARAASAALDELQAALPEPIDGIWLRAWPADFPDDIAVLRRVPYESRADSVMYCQVLADVAAGARLGGPHLRRQDRRGRGGAPAWASGQTRCSVARGRGWAHRGRRTTGWHSPPRSWRPEGLLGRTRSR